jgi:ribonuclease BN (tRNA processing enzyme)
MFSLPKYAQIMDTRTLFPQRLAPQGYNDIEAQSRKQSGERGENFERSARCHRRLDAMKSERRIRSLFVIVLSVEAVSHQLSKENPCGWDCNKLSRWMSRKVESASPDNFSRFFAFPGDPGILRCERRGFFDGQTINMKLILLGTGGYHPNRRRHTSCVMLPEIGLIFDAGTSFFRVPEHLQTEQVQIVLSHSHLDHICGLTYFLPTLLFGNVNRADVYGSVRTLEAVRDHLFCDSVFPVLPDYRYTELAGPLSVGNGGTLSHFVQEHPGTSLGFRVDWPGQSLAYLADTFCDGSSVEFVRGVDVLIHECNFADGAEEFAKLTGHSTPAPVAQMARDAKVGRLILTHIDPTLDGADPLKVDSIRKIFPATDVAEDLMEIEF